MIVEQLQHAQSDLAALVKQRRGNRTYTSVGKEAGVSATTMSAVERRVSSVSIGNLIKVAKWAETIVPLPGKWVAEYYPNIALSGTPVSTLEPVSTGNWMLDHDWGTSKPPQVPAADHFSARFTTLVAVDVEHDYVITTNADDGVRVRVDGQLLYEDWTIHPAQQHDTNVHLTAGVHTLTVEFYENEGLATLQVRWAVKTVTPPPPPDPPVGVARGSIADLCRIAQADVETRAPVGVYTGGSVNFKRPKTDGQFEGYSVIVAERAGECIIDQSAPGVQIQPGLVGNGDLIMEGEDCRFALIGFKLINGTPHLKSYLPILWYPDMSYPAAKWASEAGHPASQYHYAPRGLQFEYGNVAPQVYGADIHDTATAVATFPGSRNTLVQGARIFRLDDGGTVNDPNDVVHPDGYGAVGGNALGMRLLDTTIDLDGKAIGVMIETSADGGKTGGDSSIDMQRVWIKGAGGAGMILSTSKFKLSGTMTDVRVWDSGREHPDDDPAGWNLVYYIDGQWHNVRTGEQLPVVPGRLEITSVRVDIGVAPPAGAVDPATAWRAAHPYDSWRSTLFSTQTPTPPPSTPDPPAPPPPPIHPPDDDIRSIIEQPGGKVVTLAAGEYKGGGSGVFPHDKPLVIMAEHPGEVGLNLERVDLTLDQGSSNIVFAGFKAYNGTIMSYADDITWWYHDGSFPIEKWHQMYLAQLGGSDVGKTDQQKKDAIQRMTHPVCKAIWIGLRGPDDRLLRANRVLGSDIHDCGDDGLFFDRCVGLAEGYRVWNIDEKGLDPNVNPWRPGSDLFHNDSIQCPGGNSVITLRHGYQQATSNLGGDNSSGAYTLEDIWMAGSGAVGFLVISNNGVLTRISLKDVIGFSNGMGFPHDEGWNTLMTQFLDGVQIVRWGSNSITSKPAVSQGAGYYNVPGRFVTVDLGGNTDRIIPPQFAKSPWNPLFLADRLAPLNDPKNPALIWRKQHPYDSWRDYVPGVA